MDTVKNVWEIHTSATGMLNLEKKMFSLKQHLKWWNKYVFGNIFDNLKQAEDEWMEAELQFENLHSDEPFLWRRDFGNKSLLVSGLLMGRGTPNIFTIW